MMATPPKRIFDFGCFRVNEYKRVLLRDGQPVQLSTKAFDLLLLLIERRGQSVPSDELRIKFWGSNDVDASYLPGLVLELRTQLDDKRDKAIIRTVHRQGYQFAAHARESDAEAETDPPPPIVGDPPAPKPEPEVDPFPPNPRKQRLPILAAAFMLIAVIGIVLIFWLRPRDCLKITVPEGTVIRTDRHSLRVTGSLPEKAHLWLFVELKGGRFGWFPQKAARVKDAWEANAFFGNTGETGEFEAVAVAVDSKTDEQMEELYNREQPEGRKDLPEAVAGCRSEIIYVSKVPGP